MSGPWVGDLEYAPQGAMARILDESGDVVAEVYAPSRGVWSEGRPKALVHRANAYPKLREALEAIARNGELYASNSSEAADLVTIARAALASTREEG